jgi:uncharacterized protein YjbI with pentapeptide repeats
VKVIKPAKLGVLTRPFEHNRVYYMGVSVLGFIPIAEPPTLLPEAAMWPFVGERLGADGALDVGIPKVRGEYLINGSAFAPKGVPAPHVDVRAQVGGLVKTLRVSGERVWISSNRHSDPVPFTSMPLSWQSAYGGPELASNPLGKGHGLSELHGQQVQLLPNLEDPRALMSSARDKPEPVAFGPIDLSWPQRQRLVGTHDQHWLDNLFPGFARDIDWSFFSIASGDQQLPQGFWSGGETYEFANMHPSLAIVRGQLPRWHARVFVRRTSVLGPGVLARAKIEKAKAERVTGPLPIGELPKLPPGPEIRDADLEEIPLRLQTLWFFPDAGKAVLIWQGSLRIATDDASDVTHLLVAADEAERLRPLAHFAEQLRARVHPELGPLAALDDRPLLPKLDNEGPGLVADGMPPREGLLEQNLYAKRLREFEHGRAVVASFGLDPDEHGPAMPEPPPTPPKPEDLPAITAKALEDAKQQELKARADMAARRAKIEAELDEAKVPGMDSKILAAELDTPPSGPPTYSAAANKQLLEEVAMQCRADGWINDEVEGMLADKELYAGWVRAEQQNREGYLLAAHHQAPAPELPPDESRAKRDELKKRIIAKQRINDLNLTGVDLSRLNLRGADLSDGWFERARFDGADLTGAKLDGSVLAHCSIADAKLDDASAVRANFGNARISGTSMAGIDLTDAILEATKLTRVGVQRAKLTRARLQGITLADVDLGEITAEEMTLNEATISGLRMAGAKLERCLFIGLELNGADFQGIALKRCAFLNCVARKIDFSKAKFDSVAFVETCILSEAKFVEASLAACNLREMPLDGADFTRATLDRADLSGSTLIRAVFYRASAIEARFVKADLTDASLLAANLMGASFMHAQINGADLRGANLFGADMARVRSDRRVRLDDALLTKVRVNPKDQEPLP